MTINTLIKQILLAFEQSSTSIKYDKIYVMKDGPKNIEQITVSFGVTEFGNLKTLMKSYVDAKGKFASDFTKYMNQVGKTPLAGDTKFIELLKAAGKDPVMQQCQEAAYESMYIAPAMKWCEKNKFNLNLSKLVIADSFLQSGSILMSIRNKFAENLPLVGGNEKKWIESYCIVRKDWLATHSKKILNKTIYRMNMMLDLIEREDWNLSAPRYVANGVKITSQV